MAHVVFYIFLLVRRLYDQGNIVVEISLDFGSFP